MSGPRLSDEAAKRCPKCGETKPLSEFHLELGRADGHAVWCKPCKRASVRVSGVRGERLPFARLRFCPIAGCTRFDNKPGPTIPGAKRHVQAVHGSVAFSGVNWDDFSLYQRTDYSALAAVWESAAE